MKAILSSTNLYNNLKIISNNEYKHIEISRKQIKFVGTIYLTDAIVLCSADDNYGNEFPYVKSKWQKLCDFLSKLPEQPMVIDIDHTDGTISVKCIVNF